MTKYYKEQPKIHVALDTIIFGFRKGELHLLLRQRSVEPARGQWSLFGGFLEENESLDQAAYRILCEYTGIENIYLKQLECFGEVERDPGDRVISIAYYSLIRMAEFIPGEDQKHAARWFPLNALPPLVFDHEAMVRAGLMKLRQEARILPIGLELLPREFTMPQLQSLYEAVYQSNLDKRNFRKKILSMGVIQKLNRKDKSSSKRGAYLYSFDVDMYHEMMRKGHSFDL